MAANGDIGLGIWLGSWQELVRLIAFCRGMLIGFCAAFVLFDLCLWQGRTTAVVTHSIAYTAGQLL